MITFKHGPTQGGAEIQQQQTRHENHQCDSEIWAFPGSSVVKNPPANAGDIGSVLSLGRSHMLRSNKACVLRLLSKLVLESPGAATTEPRCCTEAHMFYSPCFATRGATAERNWCAATREKPVQQWRPSTAKNKWIRLFLKKRNLNT